MDGEAREPGHTRRAGGRSQEVIDLDACAVDDTLPVVDLSTGPTPSIAIVRLRPKPPTQVSLPPPVSLGVLLLGMVAVLAAAGALVRYYARTGAARSPAGDAAVEIPAPELEEIPAGSPTRP
jgi:hypothetical protein